MLYALDGAETPCPVRSLRSYNQPVPFDNGVPQVHSQNQRERHAKAWEVGSRKGWIETPQWLADLAVAESADIGRETVHEVPSLPSQSPLPVFVIPTKVIPL
jgi:hypothetical protein